ncbi:hypothetical protein SAMN04489717_4418 [Actinopolymorpha singaporensis]|uniref:Uncharacterized protein n=2 Tax=Actinopolymorpha singaporensis TaxID=117157 RepID=A0A1H1WCI4_9ACTN|nr:hypothetical protein SAMN04489717_4418 [Actinopolymorpha singaporensis]
MNHTGAMALPGWLSDLARGLGGSSDRARPPDAHTRSAALAALGGEGCAVCRIASEAGQRWFFAYENDTRVDLGLRERLERSFGFCAPHTRHLLDLGASASWLARWVFADVARAAVGALAAPEPPTPGPCPACEAVERAERDAVRNLASGLFDQDVRDLLLAGDGFCRTHGLAVLRRTGRDQARLVAMMLDERLTKDPVTARDVLVGVQPDAPRRRRLRERAVRSVLSAEEAGRTARPLGDADLVLDWPCCPMCAAGHLAEWRCLHWLVGLSADEAAELRGEATLCAEHLADLAGVRITSGDVGAVRLTEDGLLAPVAQVIEHVAQLWSKDLRTFVGRLDGASASAARAAAADVGQWIRCHLCERRAAAVQRTERLLGLVAADPAYAERLRDAHGVCLRHGLGTRLPAAWQQLLRARTGLLCYELEEAERKAGWDARWEIRGAEMAVWRRAPYLLDGQVLGPAVPHADGDGPA